MSKLSELLKCSFVAAALAAGFSGDVLAGLNPDQFASGFVWRDTDGNPIDAHGGCVLSWQGVYYWYGETKTGRTFLPDCNKSWGGTRVDMAGVGCYSSTNLYDWKNEGLVLAPVAGAASDLNSGNVVERPKVVFNRNSKRFVMWMHIDSADYHEARLGVAVSEKPTGPFQYLGSFRPDAGVWPINVTDADNTAGKGKYLARDFQNGQMARDMTVFVDDDGKAYVFYSSEENFTMHVSLLTDDYLRTTGKYSRILIGRSREAPAVFKHNAQYYLITSGSTGWDPNTAGAAVANSIFGPWKELGNPCIGPNADKTFLGQSSFVLPLPGSNTFIFIADLWKKWDLSNSRYLWLPLEFGGDGKPVVMWRDNWSLSVAKTANKNQDTSSDP
ncbi:MAG TPA: glycoside hydrolase family 43 protein [Alphaproteobacteria bacterium]|nr:glycoside hydrolase family 43 protein [Alphaproteobacteria bacterium]